MMSLNNLPPHLPPQNSAGGGAASSSNPNNSFGSNNNAPPAGTTPPSHLEKLLSQQSSMLSSSATTVSASNQAILSSISTTPPLFAGHSPSRQNSIWNTSIMQPTTPTTSLTNPPPPPQQQQQQQPQHQRRSSVDIWSQNNIWSQPANNPSPPFLSSPSDSTVVNSSAGNNTNTNNNYYPGVPLSNKSSFAGISSNSSSNALYQQQQQQAPQQIQPSVYASNNQSNMAGGALPEDYQSYSPTSIDLNPFELRRHSYSDIYNFNSNPNANNTASNQSVLGPPAPLPITTTSASTSMDSTFQLVNEYFETDPHERVKVTLKLLEERFFDEEKYLGEAYQLPKFLTENALRDCQLVLVGFKAGRIDVFYLPSNPSPDLINLKVGDLVIVEADRGKDLGKVFKMNISIDEARLMKLLQFQEQQAALNESDFVDEHLSVKQMSESNNSANPSVAPPTLHFPKPIVSLAQTNEIFQILNKKQDEEKACRLCLAKIVAATGQLSNSISMNNGGIINGGVNNPNSPMNSPISTLSSSTQADLLQMKLIDAEYQFDRKKLIFYYSTSKRIDFRELVRELFRIYKTRIWMCAVVGLPYTLSGSSAVNSAMPLAPLPSRNSISSSNSSYMNSSPTSSYTQPRLNDPFGNYNNNNQQQQQQQQQQSSQPQQQGPPHGFFDRRFSLQTTSSNPQYQYSSINNDLIQIPRRYLAEHQQQSRQGQQQFQEQQVAPQTQQQAYGHVHVRSQSFSQGPAAHQSQQFWGQQQQQQLQQQSSQPVSYSQTSTSSQQQQLQSHFGFQQSQSMIPAPQVPPPSHGQTPTHELPFKKEGEDGSTSSFSSTSGDSPFMLKSLVDSINH